MSKNISELVIFAGIAENINIRDNIFLDVLGCCQLFHCTTIPANLSNRYALIGIRSDAEDILDGTSIIIRSRINPNSFIKIDVSTPQEDTPDAGSRDSIAVNSGNVSDAKDGLVHMYRSKPESMTYTIIPLPLTKFVATCQGTYDIIFSDGTTEHCIGSTEVRINISPEITPQRIANILLNDPNTESVNLRAGCSKCNMFVSSGYAFKNEHFPEPKPNEKYIKYDSLTGSWECGCKTVEINLNDLKQSIRNVVNQQSFSDADISVPVSAKFLQLRNKSVIARFSDLMHSSDRESDFQDFFQSNPTVWNWLSPYKIIAKPKILTDYVADFGIININQELILIEIERPQTLLITKGGNFAAEAQHAIDQTRDWRHAIELDRQACMKSMKIQNENIRAIKYLVIAGLKKSIEDQSRFNSRIKSGMPNDTSFYTFDEMESFVRASLDGLISTLLT